MFTTIFLLFLLTLHSSVFQIISWNWKQLINHKVQAKKKVFWHMILHSYLYKALCKFSLKSKATNVFPKHILKSKARDKSIQERKKLFCHVIVKNYLFNVLCNLLMKFESTWRHKMWTALWQDCQKQPPEVFYKKNYL